MPPTVRQASFRQRGHRLAYSDYGGEGIPLILMPGLLLPREMHHPLARDLAEMGHRVVTFDLLGHGQSDRPLDMSQHSVSLYADDCIALLDHLEVGRAVIGGTSLGGNVTLEVASRAPRRVAAMVVEMPVLDSGLIFSALTFSPFLVGLTMGNRIWSPVARGLRGIPRRLLPFYANIALDLIRQEPRPSAAVMQGVFFGRVAPPRSERRTFTAPALVIGHRRDPVHAFSDADMLARELPNGRLVQASSIFELRFTPKRLTLKIHDFLLEVAPPRLRAVPATGRRQSAGRRRASGGRPGQRSTAQAMSRSG
ncbi:MAG TPA: alpha/beta hydrolase [Candidatus Binatia bacterium]|nr:alpha/beta hydrolase [Candidatus Binatia bacterium]